MLIWSTTYKTKNYYNIDSQNNFGEKNLVQGKTAIIINLFYFVRSYCLIKNYSSSLNLIIYITNGLFDFIMDKLSAYTNKVVFYRSAL